MKRLVKTFLIIAAALSFGCSPKFAWNMSKPEEAGLSAMELQQIRDSVQHQIDLHRIPGAVTAVVKDGKLVWYEAQGMADPIEGKHMTKDALFRMMSSSKVVTSIAVLMLMEDGKINLDDPVSRFIPEFRDMKVADNPPMNLDPAKVRLVNADREVTVKDLLTHTSGLNSFGAGMMMLNHIERKEGDALSDYVPRLGDAVLDFQPGTKWSYSPLDGMDVLARIVEIASGESFDAFLGHRLFKPLQMNDTWFLVPESERERILNPFTWKDGKWERVKDELAGPYGSETYTCGAGGLFSTAHDFMNMEIMLLNKGSFNGKRILKEETVELMASNQVGTLFADWLPGITRGGFGLGVGVVLDENSPGGRGKGSFGWGGAYGTESWADPEHNVAAVFFIQASPAPSEPKEAFQRAVRNAVEHRDLTPVATSSVQPGGPSVETVTYAVKDGRPLVMDLYLDPSVKVEGKRPVMIYSFGGGWESGDEKQGAGLAEFFAKQGFLGVSIQYRLGMKAYKESHDLPATEVPGPEHFAKAFSSAISIGVEDLYDATSYIVNNAEKWNVDPERILISGGSAGATNSNMAEWYICNEDPMAKEHLPEGFNYAGVISMAGGIWKVGAEEPEWKNQPCPYLFFHGTKDQLVPYGAAPAADLNFGAFGPGFLKDQFKEKKFPFHAVTVNESDHIISGLPMQTSLWDMISFYERFVKAGQKICIETEENYYEDVPSLLGFLLKAVQENEELKNNSDLQKLLGNGQE